MFRGRAALPILLIALAPAHGQDATPSGTAPEPGASMTTLHATARLVVLDVVVTDNGRPVNGLQPSDFRLFEDGVAQRLASFTEHDAAPPPPPPDQFVAQPALPPNTFAVQPPVTGNGAMSVIVLGNLAFADAPFVRDQLRDYLKSSTPSTAIAIFRIDWQGLHLVQGFTADRAVLLEAATSKRILPPLGFPSLSGTFARGSLQLTRYLQRIPGRINLIWFGSPTGAQRRFPDITTFVRDFRGSTAVLQLCRVALYTVDAGGLVGSGFSAANPGMTASMPYASFDPTGLSQDATGVPDPFGLGLNSGARSPTGLFSIPDPHGFFAHAEVDDLATALGGRAFYNTNGFKEIIGQVVDTGSHFYTLSYSPTNPDWNGAFRSIHIEVSNIPKSTYSPSLYARLLGWTDPGIKVQYRRGYNARSVPSPAGPAAKPAPAASDPSAPPAEAAPQRRLISVSPKGDPAPKRNLMQSAMEFSSLTPTGVHFTVTVTPVPEVVKTKRGTPLPQGNFLTAPFQNTPYRNFRIHYSIDAQDLEFQRTASGASRDDLQFVAIFCRDDGAEANSTAAMTHVEVDAAKLDWIMRSGLGFDQTIALPTSGNFFLRAGVRELSSEHVGAIEIPTEWIKPAAALSREKRAP